jgi:hypothetical protein
VICATLHLLLFVFGLSVPLHAEIEVEHDRFDNSTTVKTKLTTERPRGKPRILLHGIYEKGQPVASVGIILITSSDNWRYIQCTQTHWLVDDKPFQLPQPTHKGSVGSGYVIEQLIIANVPIKQIEQLAQAKKVEFKVCNDEYMATTEEVKDFGIFFSKLRESAPKKAP